MRYLSTPSTSLKIDSVGTTHFSIFPSKRYFSTTPTNLCTSSSSDSAVVDDANVLWENLLRFDYIPLVVFLSRLKVFQTVLTFVLLPYVGHMCFVTQTEPVETFYLVTAMTAVAAAMLLVITRISQVEEKRRLGRSLIKCNTDVKLVFDNFL